MAQNVGADALQSILTLIGELDPAVEDGVAIVEGLGNMIPGLIDAVKTMLGIAPAQAPIGPTVAQDMSQLASDLAQPLTPPAAKPAS